MSYQNGVLKLNLKKEITIMQNKQLFKKTITSELEFNYLVYTPKIRGGEKLPLILFLHGAGERGDDVEILKCHSIPKMFEQDLDYNCVVVSPQCSSDTFWVAQLSNLKHFIDGIVEEYNIDESRIYLTGVSMGGYGSWFLATAYPKIFAAVAPICGGGMPWNAGALKEIPIWAFHGLLDEVVMPQESIDMVNAVNSAGGNAKLTLVDDVAHDVWNNAYNNELIEWLLSKKNV